MKDNKFSKISISKIESTYELPAYGYVLYIDEAGDDSLTNVVPIDEGGASEWLVLSGVLIRKQNEPLVDQWATDIRLQVGQIQGDSLHYRKMSGHYRAKSCSLVSQLPVRCFVVASNKKNMRRYDNPRASVQNNPQWYYNFCVRLLLERASEMCKNDVRRGHGQSKKLKVVFSERGAHSYPQTAAYIEKLIFQSRSKSTYLRTREIEFDVMDSRLIKSQPHFDNGGLQIADIVASAFYQAVDTKVRKNWTISNAISLLPVMAMKNGNAASQGLVLQPTPAKAANLNAKQSEIFRYFGYDI